MHSLKGKIFMGKILTAFGAGMLALGVATIGNALANSSDVNADVEKLNSIKTQKEAIVSEVSAKDDFKQYLKDKFDEKYEAYNKGEISKFELSKAGEYLIADSNDSVVMDANVEGYLQDKTGDVSEFSKLREEEYLLSAQINDNAIKTEGGLLLGGSLAFAGGLVLAIENGSRKADEIAFDIEGGPTNDDEENFVC